jgi:ribosomal protein S13
MATLKKLMTLFSKQGIDNDFRRTIIDGFTKGRTNSVKDLTTEEIEKLCERLCPQSAAAADLELEMRKRRSVILAIATRTGIKKESNWDKFNNWMLNSSIFKKELHKYDNDELRQLERQMRALEANYNISAEKAGTKAWHHNTGIPKPCVN